eukprot:TRINITY_DN24396_c0_g1_i1.p1 TRINITY_DN24396_c0_g1~~TRINITY_DN24396_c0_g1_i1.p1  ORF type:complete len:255 (+),score=34.21 TRINITY_DN24396_c0_g1_i1:44-808(+)
MQSVAAIRFSRSRVVPRLVVCQQTQKVDWKSVEVVKRNLVVKDRVEVHKIVLDVGQKLSEQHTRAGQFMQIKIDDFKPGFFAIANSPQSQDTTLEFLVKSSGQTAEALCTKTALDVVEVSDVLGKGFGDTNEFNNIILFATGTGIAPVKALIESGALSQDKDITLYYGAYNQACMAYQELFPLWNEVGVRIVPVYSERDGKYVQDVFKQADNSVLVQNPSQSCAVVVGQKEMYSAIIDILKDFGISKEQVITNF